MKKVDTDVEKFALIPKPNSFIMTNLNFHIISNICSKQNQKSLAVINNLLY